jgi:alpha-L-rhamnosidase
VLGVTPVDPGYATWSIAPHPGDLTWAQGAVPTKYGEITVQWLSTAPAFVLHADTPRGTTGAITVPAGPRSVVIVNGRIACARGTCTAYQGRFDGGQVHLTVPGGRYTILVAGG